MKETTLVIMAAGIGSRFGKGTKQLTPVGPSGELIIDYSIHDAIEAGFNKVVFIIRPELLDEFKQIIGDRISKIVDVEYVFQKVDVLPNGFKSSEGRIKPWGTGQAVLCCKGVVNTPFAVVNADDYYGVGTYKIVHDYIASDDYAKGSILDICMVGFRLGNTLSENGGVTRGVCVVDENNLLVEIKETRNIEKGKDGGLIRTKDGTISLAAETLVSMNMWGFSPEFISFLDEGFSKFLNGLEEGDITSEFLLPGYVDEILKAKKAKVRVLDTDETWFGVTFQEDKEPVRKAFAQLVERGVYKRTLFD